MSQSDPHAIYGPPHPPRLLPTPPAPPTPTAEEARAALALARRPAIPVRRRHLALFALSDIGILAVIVVLFIGVIPSGWPPLLVALLAGASVLPPALLKNLVPVVPKIARRISLIGSLVTLPAIFVGFSLDDLAFAARLLIVLTPSIVAGVLLVLVGARRP